MRIYLDHNATTPVDPVAADAMMRSLQHLFGNASSVHYYGQQAKAAIDDARTSVAALVGAEPAEIIFTSGGTEADNFAIRGAAEALEVTGRRHLITSGIEHEAVLNTFKALAKRGWRTTVLPLDSTGIISPDRLQRRHHRRHRARVDDAREQRNRHDSAHRRTCDDRARARRRLPYRRGAKRRQDSGQRASARSRSAVPVRSQVLRPEGCRRSVGETRRPPGALSQPEANRSGTAERAPRTCRA